MIAQMIVCIRHCNIENDSTPQLGKISSRIRSVVA